MTVIRGEESRGKRKQKKMSWNILNVASLHCSVAEFLFLPFVWCRLVLMFSCSLVFGIDAHTRDSKGMFQPRGGSERSKGKRQGGCGMEKSKQVMGSSVQHLLRPLSKISTAFLLSSDHRLTVFGAWSLSLLGSLGLFPCPSSPQHPKGQRSGKRNKEEKENKEKHPISTDPGQSTGTSGPEGEKGEEREGGRGGPCGLGLLGMHRLRQQLLTA